MVPKIEITKVPCEMIEEIKMSFSINTSEAFELLKNVFLFKI